MSEDKNRATIGQRIFSEIDSDRYLNKLYSYLLFNYALKLFSPESIKPKEINYIDALRFADLLSKSNDPKKAESHHTWAQEIVALVKELQGDNPILRVYMDSILLSTGNYQGLDLQEREHKKNDQTAVPRYDLLEQFYQEHRKRIMQFLLIRINTSFMFKKGYTITFTISISAIRLRHLWGNLI